MKYLPNRDSINERQTALFFFLHTGRQARRHEAKIWAVRASFLLSQTWGVLIKSNSCWSQRLFGIFSIWTFVAYFPQHSERETDKARWEWRKRGSRERGKGRLKEQGLFKNFKGPFYLFTCNVSHVSHECCIVSVYEYCIEA